MDSFKGKDSNRDSGHYYAEEMRQVEELQKLVWE